MLARPYRLTEEADFNRVKEKGRLTQSDSFALACYKSREDGEARFGFIISNRISPNASQRNRVRRALAEGVRFNFYRMKKGYDIVILAKPTIISRYTADLIKEVKAALEKAKVVNE